MEQTNSKELTPSDVVASERTIGSEHGKHCFIVMPFGRLPKERKWFKGWYEVVIKLAVTNAGYEPVLAAAEEQPGAINDEIRAHLAFDPMVVVDLGGFELEDPPNPNVMYELGIRHAFGLPLVMMAWKDQSLPFDVRNQRVIIEERSILDQATNRDRLIAFITSARAGKFYRPMDAVGRHAVIDTAYASLGEESILGTLAHEVRDLRATVAATLVRGRRVVSRPKIRTLKTMMGKKELRKQLYAQFLEAGGRPKEWAHLLNRPVSDDSANEMADWREDDWAAHFSTEATRLGELRSEEEKAIANARQLTKRATQEVLPPEEEKFLQEVKNALPDQPWPSGVHKTVADQLGVSPKEVQAAIHILIQRREVHRQIDGVVYQSRDEPETIQGTDDDV